MCQKNGTHDLDRVMSRPSNLPEGLNDQPTGVEEPPQKQYRVQELVDNLYDHIWIEYHLGYSFGQIKAHIGQTCPDLKIVDVQNFKPKKLEYYFFQIERKGRVTGNLKMHFFRKHGILSALQ